MQSQLKGIFLKIISVTLVIMLSGFIKIFPDDAPITQIVFFRVSFSIPFVLGYLYLKEKRDWQRMREKLTPHRFSMIFRRSFLGMIGMAMIFLSLRLLPLPIAQAIRELQPVVTTILAVIFLKETIRVFRTLGLVLGVIGVSLVIYQIYLGGNESASADALKWGVLAGLISVFCSALVQIHLRSMVATEHPEAIVFWFFLITSVVSLCTLPFGWVWPSPQGWLCLIAIGLCGAFSQLTQTIAYQYADASTIAPFEYFSIPLALFVGLIFFSEWPKPLSLLGIGFILAGGLIIIYREGQISRKKRHDLQNFSRG